MGYYHSTFYNCSIDVDLEAFRRHFVSYNSENWSEDGGGSLQYFTDDNQVISLIILHNPRYGIILSFDGYDEVKERTVFNYYSVGCIDKISDFKDVGDDQFYPIGSFLKPEIAWLAVEDFFKNPLKLSEQIEWINSEDLNWPEY